MCPEKFAMQADMKKKRMKNIIEGTMYMVLWRKEEDIWKPEKKAFDIRTHTHIEEELG